MERIRLDARAASLAAETEAFERRTADANASIAADRQLLSRERDALLKVPASLLLVVFVCKYVAPPIPPA